MWLAKFQRSFHIGNQLKNCYSTLCITGRVKYIDSIILPRNGNGICIYSRLSAKPSPLGHPGLLTRLHLTAAAPCTFSHTGKCISHVGNRGLFRNYIPKTVHRPCYIRFTSNGPDDPEHEELRKKFRDDPEVRDWLREIQEDFSSTTQSQSDQSSDSDSDSDLSESDNENMTGRTGGDSDSFSEGNDGVQSSGMSASSSLDQNVTNEEEEEYEYEDFYGEYEDMEEELTEKEVPISLSRGATGVYDVEELVTLLREENGRDICVIAIPAEYKYVDHLVIVTGRSTRHIIAMAELVRWVFKRKRGRGDPKSVNIEGRLTKDWMALDLGNIALHLFLGETRQKYDLETLWTLGTEFDLKSQQEEDPYALFVDQPFTLAPPDELMPPGAHQEHYDSENKEPVTSFGSMESLGGWHRGTKTKL